LLGLVKDWGDFLSGSSFAMESAVRKFSRIGRRAGDARAGSFLLDDFMNLEYNFMKK